MGVISDIQFPLGEGGEASASAGLELAQRIKEARPDIPILLQSSNPAIRDSRESVASGFLLKGSPVMLDEIRQYLTDHSFFGDFVFRLAVTGRRWTGRATSGPSWRSWRRSRPRASGTMRRERLLELAQGPGGVRLGLPPSAPAGLGLRLPGGSAGGSDSIPSGPTGGNRAAARWRTSIRKSSPTPVGS